MFKSTTTSFYIIGVAFFLLVGPIGSYSQMTIDQEAEFFTFSSGPNAPITKSRSEASNNQTIWVRDQGSAVHYTIPWPEAGFDSLLIRYSNDNFGTLDSATVLANGSVIGGFRCLDTGDSGSGWNVFTLSPAFELPPPSGDSLTITLYLEESNLGVEFDLLSFYCFPCTTPTYEHYLIGVDACRNDSSDSTNNLDGSQVFLNSEMISYSGNGESYEISSTSGLPFTYGGVSYKLNGHNNNALSRNFNAIFEPEILPEHQGVIDSVIIRLEDIISPTNNEDIELKLEFKDVNGAIFQTIIRANLISASYPSRIAISLESLPETMVSELVVVFDNLAPSDVVKMDQLQLVARVPSLESTAHAAFLWSYNALLETLDRESWMVKDKGRDLIGVQEGVTATAKLAKTTYYAYKLGFINYTDARLIITSISDQFINTIPTGPAELLPHFTQNGGTENHDCSEWSSVDSAIALLDLIVALQLLDDPEEQAGQVIAILQNIAWEDLTTILDGNLVISHGFTCDGMPLASSWGDFGMETIAVNWAYASATGNLAHMDTLPSFGSGFIDNAQFPMVINGFDIWGNNWDASRLEMANLQINWYREFNPNNPFLSLLPIFGLSAAETPEGTIYAAYRVEGFATSFDGNGEIIVPHLHAMLSDIKPTESIAMWEFLRDRTGPNLPDMKNIIFVSPWNMVESFRVNKNTGRLTVNHLKSSWNLALQAEGWANYFEECRSELENAIQANDFLHSGKDLLVSNKSIVKSEPVISVFPNPFQSSISIKSPEVLPSEIQLMVFDQLGRKTGAPWHWHSDTRTQINLNSLPPGTYWLVGFSRGRKLFKKQILKQ